MMIKIMLTMMMIKKNHYYYYNNITQLEKHTNVPEFEV